MRALESPLGLRLFNRTARSVALTESGERLLRRVRPAYPDIHVEFVLDARWVDIAADDFDAGIRRHENVPRDMVAVRFGPHMRMVAVASPEHLGQHGTPAAPPDLARHRCRRLRFGSGAIYRRDLERDGNIANIDVAGPFTFNNVKLIAEAALAGLGIGWVGADQVEAHLTAGRLIQVLADWSASFPGWCLYHPANRHPPIALRLFGDAVRAWARSAGRQPA